MADSVVDKKSNSNEDYQLPCSTSSLSPVNNVLTDTSNLQDKSKLLLEDESSVQQIEQKEGVKHESPVQKNMEGVEHESPVQKNMEGVKHESPVQKNMEGAENESPVQKNMEGVEHESPVQKNMEGAEHESPVQKNMEGVEHESPVQKNMDGMEHESPVQKNMEDVEHESSTPSNEKKDDFVPGDIVWAKLGRHPFWPSMVCIDPETNIYMKGSLENKRQFSLHVRFCNDQGRRSWAKTIEMYSGKEDFLSKYPNGLAFIKNSKKQMAVWEQAVKEADYWMKIYNRYDRLTRFSLRNGLTDSKISGLGPKPRNTFKTPNAPTRPTPSTKTPNAPTRPTPSTSAGKSYTPKEFMAEQKALRESCQPSTSGSQGIKCEASTSGSNIRSCYDQLKKKNSIVEEDDEPDAVPLPKDELSIPELFKPKPATKRKYVDAKKKALREEAKKKKAKRALQVKKYGFSYSSSEYESTDDEAEPLVPFNPNRKVLESIKYAVANLESKGMKKEREKRLLIKAIRLAERRKSKKNREKEEEEEEEEDEEQY